MSPRMTPGLSPSVSGVRFLVHSKGSGDPVGYKNFDQAAAPSAEARGVTELRWLAATGGGRRLRRVPTVPSVRSAPSIAHGRVPQDGSNSKARVRVIRLSRSPSAPIT